LEKMTMKRLIAGALFSARVAEEQRLRARRHIDGVYHPEGVTDVRTPERCWERAVTGFRQIDPDGSRALQLFRMLDD
jgi:hypothetical protein